MNTQKLDMLYLIDDITIDWDLKVIQVIISLLGQITEYNKVSFVNIYW